MELLNISGLHKRFGRKQVLNNLDMSLSQGKIVGLLGPNGSGKTTLMKSIAGLVKPDKGTIAYPGGARRGVESKGVIAFLPDTLTFPAWFKVKDAFAFYEKYYPDYDRKKAAEMQTILKLNLDDTVKKLSKGMQERVALGVTFARRAPLYLLDEPLGGIDPVGRARALESIIAAHGEESTILLSTHLIKDVETVLDSVLLIKGGKIAMAEDCEDLRQQGKKVEDIYLEVFDVV